jgi:hypothetical protein
VLGFKVFDKIELRKIGQLRLRRPGVDGELGLQSTA